MKITLKELFGFVLLILVFFVLYLLISGKLHIINDILGLGDEQVGPEGLGDEQVGPEGNTCNVNIPECDLAVAHAPSMSVSEIDAVLKKANSPVLQENPNMASFFYSESSRTGIDVAIALAFFKQESNYGTAGNMVKETKSMGNIRYTKTCKDEYGGSDYNGFCKYPTWKKGIEAWYNLIEDGYVDQGYTTLKAVVLRYAPCNENNALAYIKGVKDFVAKYTNRDVSMCYV